MPNRSGCLHKRPDIKYYSISQLAKEFGLTRSTLLHYDSVSLLKPITRTSSNYRVYTDKEYARLQRIVSLRSTGISLEQIRQIIDSDKSAVGEILHQRVDQINIEIKNLRFQQQFIVTLLNNEGLLKSTRILTKDIWVDLLKSAGLDEDGMHRWHMEFERSAPEAHRDFLESLGLSSEEIANIRNWSKKLE